MGEMTIRLANTNEIYWSGGNAMERKGRPMPFSHGEGAAHWPPVRGQEGGSPCPQDTWRGGLSRGGVEGPE